MASRDSNEYVGNADTTIPASTDLIKNWDDELRQVKTQMNNSFPNVTGPVTPTHTVLNYMLGVSSNVQDQLNAKAPTSTTPTIDDPAFTGSSTITSTSPSYDLIESDAGHTNNRLRLGAQGDQLVISQRENNGTYLKNLIVIDVDPAGNGATEFNFRLGDTNALRILSDGSIRTGSTNYETLIDNEDDIPNKAYVDGFASSPQTISSGTSQLIQVAHGLGSLPSRVGVHLTTAAGNQGYTDVGEGSNIELSPYQYDGGSGWSLTCDATNVYFMYDSAALMTLRNFNNQNWDTFTESNWRVVLKAYL